jgi:hypothetical protein
MRKVYSLLFQSIVKVHSTPNAGIVPPSDWYGYGICVTGRNIDSFRRMDIKGTVSIDEN